MGKPFSVNVNRFEPYKAFRFLVYLEQSTSPVAGIRPQARRIAWIS